MMKDQEGAERKMTEWILGKWVVKMEQNFQIMFTGWLLYWWY
jgi:hypothetical protein